MTEIIRSLKIEAPLQNVWALFDIRTWPDFSNLFPAVAINTKILRVKSTAEIQSYLTREKIQYTATILAYSPHEKLEYSRYNGPLPGNSVWNLCRAEKGMRIEYVNVFEHKLTDRLQAEIGRNMERFLTDIQKCI
ncbi:MAG: hypothetical protein DWQ05_21005 [Calditrichaeota bacterium]|nr:MAG: hypothetical protein DWQ05_21005 [Calditrichota bacterium]